MEEMSMRKPVPWHAFTIRIRQTETTGDTGTGCFADMDQTERKIYSKIGVSIGGGESLVVVVLVVDGFYFSLWGSHHQYDRVVSFISIKTGRC
mmetsp:Transcript_6324/g.18206  ORF Transcript_6324/g.18206 Transcript_6324/m.18206 type:complete len:93 (-) Transcript_6324:227-505(-)